MVIEKGGTTELAMIYVHKSRYSANGVQFSNGSYRAYVFIEVFFLVLRGFRAFKGEQFSYFK